MRIAILDDYQGIALEMADWSSLHDRAEISVFRDTLKDEQALIERLKEFEILCLMRERTPITRHLLEHLPNLRFIFTTGMRNNAIDIRACRDHGVDVTGSPALGYPVAELTLGLILALARQIPRETGMLHQGDWVGVVGRGLKGRTLGILGVGRVGSEVARLAQAFGMRVIAWTADPNPDRFARAGVEPALTKEALLEKSDFVSIHLLLSDRTRKSFGAAEFEAMRPTAYFINTARGALVDEHALIHALTAGLIAGAGLDVYEDEPLPIDHPLRGLDNAILLPHSGYVVEENYQIFYRSAVENVGAWLAGEVINRVTNGLD